MSADVDVPSLAPPTPSTVSHAPPPAWLSRAQLMPVAVVVQRGLEPCLSRVGLRSAAVAAAPSPDTLAAVEPPHAALQHEQLGKPFLVVSTKNNEAKHTSHMKSNTLV